MLSKFTLVFLLVFFITSVVKADQSHVDEILLLAKELRLSEHPTWIKLMHYEKNADGFVSAIADESFFTAEDGAFNSAAELEASIKLFQKPFVVGAQDSQPQCRFPARFLFLKRLLADVFDSIQTVPCPKYDQWALNDSSKSISIVYASGFLANPASYYGHVLLKLNSNKSNGDAILLDSSINYGALIPPNENPIRYLVKGVFGGYEGGFSQTGYYFHSRNYGELELRDLWEYELNLQPWEVEFIIAHAWEVLGKRYRYYFFRKNCAYRLAELLEIVDGVSLIPSNPFFMLPRALLQNMANNSIDGKPLLRSVGYRPSRQSRFYQKFKQLNLSERHEIRKLIEGGQGFDLETATGLTINSKVKVVDTALDYYQFAKFSDILPANEANDLHQKALVERFKLPPSKQATGMANIKPPHKGRKSSYAQFGFSFNESLGSGYSILLRPAYYDVLDAAPGQLTDSALIMGELGLQALDGKLQLSHLDLLRIEGVNTANTGLPGDKSTAWKIKFGLQQQNLACVDCLATRLEGDYGYALNLSPAVLLSGYIGGGVQDNRQGSGNAFIRTSIYSHITVTDKLTMRLGAELPKQLDGSGGHKSRYLLEARQQLGINSDVRFSYQKNQASQYGVNLGFYF